MELKDIKECNETILTESKITESIFWLDSALREFYKVKPADYMPSSMGPDLRRVNVAARCPGLAASKEDNIPPVLLNGDPPAHLSEDKAVGQSMFRQLAEDEFFDVPEDSPWDLELEPDGQQLTDLEGASDEDQVSLSLSLFLIFDFLNSIFD